MLKLLLHKRASRLFFTGAEQAQWRLFASQSGHSADVVQQPFWHYWAMELVAHLLQKMPIARAKNSLTAQWIGPSSRHRSRLQTQRYRQFNDRHPFSIHVKSPRQVHSNYQSPQPTFNCCRGLGNWVGGDTDAARDSPKLRPSKLNIRLQEKALLYPIL